MEKLFTIGQLARSAEVPTSTVRYYEREGILAPTTRSASNYRLYSQEDLYRLRFIRAAQATGFKLEDTTALLLPAPCGEVQERLERRLAQVTERMRELRHVQRVLRESLAACREHEESGRCHVVDALSASARASRPRA